MASDIIQGCLGLIQVIYKMVDDKRTTDNKVKEMIERVMSLEQPLQVLQRNCRNPTAYEIAFKRLVDVLNRTEKFIKSIRDDSSLNKAKNWVVGGINVQKAATLNSLLNDSLMDLQTAIQAEESERSEARVQETAIATAKAIYEAERLRNMETVRLCVQCGSEYKESSNAEGSCKYHKTFPVGGWDYTFNCCGQTLKNYDQGFTTGCERGKHRDAHHVDYTYASYFRWTRTENDNEESELCRVYQKDLEDSYEKFASFGQTKDGKYFVKLGKGHFVLFRQNFTLDELMSLECGDGHLIANRGSDERPGEFDQSTDDLQWFSKAYWIGKSGKLVGIKLSCKSLNGTQPNTTIYYFDVSDLPKIKNSEVIYDSNTYKIDPSTLPQYQLPTKVEKFTPFPEHVFVERKAKMDFPTQSSEGLKIRIKQSSKCLANANSSGFTSDNFLTSFMILHLGQTGSKGSSREERLMILNMVKDGNVSVDDGVKLITAVENSNADDSAYTFIEVRSEYQFEGDQDWKPTEFDTTLEEIKLPFEVQPKSAISCKVKCTVSDKKKSGSWFNNAFVSRLKPIRFRITFEEMSGKTASTIVEFINSPSSFPQREKEDVFFLPMDHLESWDRFFFRVTPPKDESEANEMVFQIKRPGRSFYVKEDLLRAWAYNAMKEQNSEYCIADYTENEYEVRALVDLEFGLVYGFKFTIQKDDQVASESWLIPTKWLAL